MSNPRHRELRERALKGGTRYLPKLREQNKLTARERLDLLLDKGSFIEDGLYANVLEEEQGLDLSKLARPTSTWTYMVNDNPLSDDTLSTLSLPGIFR